MHSNVQRESVQHLLQRHSVGPVSGLKDAVLLQARKEPTTQAHSPGALLPDHVLLLQTDMLPEMLTFI